MTLTYWITAAALIAVILLMVVTALNIGRRGRP